MRHRFIDLLEQSPVIPAVKAEAALPCALACESRVLFLLGGDLLTIRRLEKEMKEASKMLEFEYAALLRDQIIELRGQK